MNIFGYMQKVGSSVMVPVSVLPAAAILMGIGYWIDPNGWGAGSALAALLIKAGGAVINNMSILFAVGVAYGMSKDKDGAAALAGLVGFLILTTLLSPSALVQIHGFLPTDIPYAFHNVNNQFIGILVGIISGELYNKFSNVELPNSLAFFSGRRLVPIIVSIVMVAVAFILMVLWPVIFSSLQSFGEKIAGLGDVGAGIYALFNRLLVPVGLHHALNSLFWFDIAGINDIPNFLSGQAGIDAGTAIVGQTGMYQAGFFPIMMFGLPGAALAIYSAAHAENKEKIGSMMLAASVSSFFTGVTEPLEFSFMFAAPVLYAVHAVLTGVSVFFAANMQWMAGFGFSAGLVDMVLSSQNPLATQWHMLIAQGGAFFVIYYLLFFGLIKALNLKTPGREGEPADKPKVKTVAPKVAKAAAPKDTSSDLARKYVEAFGGIDNLDVIDACVTRLRLSLKDNSIVDEERLKEIGAIGVVKFGQNNLQVIIGPQADRIAQRIKRLK